MAIVSDNLRSEDFARFVGMTFFKPALKLPTLRDLESLNFLFLFGPLRDSASAAALAGTLKLARERGLVIVCVYEQHLGTEAVVLRRLGVPDWNTTGGPRFAQVSDEAFRTYLTEYGISGTTWSQYDLEHAETLGTVGYGDAVAFRMPGSGPRPAALYVVPYHLPPQASPLDMFQSLYQAVAKRERAAPNEVPAFLAGVRLGETEERVLADVTTLSTAFAEKVAEARELADWRHLIGSTSGSPLVALIVDALNAVLDGSGYHAEERKDVGEEDFWIVGPDGDYALGEAKGVNGGVGREDVSKVDVHRSALGHDERMPGILIMNVFRKSENLERRQTAEVVPNVIELAKVQNVLAVQTWDLYQLVGLKLNGARRWAEARRGAAQRWRSAVR